MDQHIDNLRAELINEAFDRAYADAPNFGVTAAEFTASVSRTIDKYLLSSSDEPLSEADLREFFANLQAADLMMALGCAAGNERAWWEFDQTHRSYMERVARHLARTEIDADEVIGSVYVELYGTRIVDGERVSKFASYSGRGSIRGWLRTIIWHSLVDQHRASHDEVSLDEMTENIGEGAAHSNFATQPAGGEGAMVADVTRARYAAATAAAIGAAIDALEPHERLLLKLYHVDDLKLREISRLVENEDSPLRGWFQRRSQTRAADPGSRIHESTVMRWLEKSYAIVLKNFRAELAEKHGLGTEEIEICQGLAVGDLAGPDIYKNLAAK